MLRRYLYQDWTILIFVDDNSGQWKFSCCPPFGDALGHSEEYSTSEATLLAAIAFVERLEVRCQIANMLDNWLEEKRISPREHRQTNELLAVLATLSVPRPLGAPKPPEPPSESPPNLTP